MKKRVFFLFVLALVFVLSLSFGAVAFADTDSSNEDSAYSSMWKTSTAVKVTKDVDGAKIEFKSAGDTAEYNYNFSIGDDCSVVFTIAGFPYGVDGDILQLKLNSDNSDTLMFSKVEESFKVKLGDEEVDLTDFDSLKLEVKEGKVFIDGTEIGESAITNDYAKLQFQSKTSVNVFFKTINDKVDFVNNTFIYGAKLDYKDGTFFTRTNAIFGFDYDVNFVAYDTASAITLTLTYQKDGWEQPKEAKASNKIRFGSEGTYTVTLTAVSEDSYDDPDTTESEKTVTKFEFTYTVTASTESTAISFKDKTANEQAYQKISDGINEEIITNYEEYKQDAENNPATYISIGDNFYYPSVEDIIDSKYFDVSSLSLSLCYASITNSDFVSTTNKYFEITSMGKYCYFILPTDSCGNGFVYDQDFKDTYELKEDGWYDQSDNLIVPVFRFEVIDNSPPEVTAGFESKAYIGKDYKVTSITINASSYTADYQLYFMTVEDFNEYYQTNGKFFNRDSFKNGDELDTEAYNTELERLVSLGKLSEVKNVSELQSGEEVSDAFNTSTLTFKPKKGYYYLVCSVNSENGMSDYVITYAINATYKTSSAVFEAEWWRHNWKSVTYLGISGLSLVGILLLLFVKPKKKNINKNEEV